VPFCERPNKKPEGFAKQKQPAIFAMRHASHLVVHHPSLIYNVLYNHRNTFATYTTKNSALVLLTDHLAPTSEFSAEEEEKEVNSNSTSRGDLDSDPAASLLSPVLIRQQAATIEEEEGCSCQQEGETKYKTKTKATAMRT
jgi:hypothetical protein